MATKQTKAKQFRNEQLECVSFFDQDKLDENELKSFTDALQKGISNIPQARKAYRIAELEEYKWRQDNQLNDESRKQRDDMYSHFKKIGGELPAVERYYYPIQKEESQYAFYLYQFPSDSLFAFGENRDDLYICLQNQFQNHHRKHSFLYHSFSDFLSYPKFQIERCLVLYFI